MSEATLRLRGGWGLAHVRDGTRWVLIVGLVLVGLVALAEEPDTSFCAGVFLETTPAIRDGARSVAWNDHGE